MKGATGLSWAQVRFFWPWIYLDRRFWPIFADFSTIFWLRGQFLRFGLDRGSTENLAQGSSL